MVFHTKSPLKELLPEKGTEFQVAFSLPYEDDNLTTSQTVSPLPYEDDNLTTSQTVSQETATGRDVSSSSSQSDDSRTQTQSPPQSHNQQSEEQGRADKSSTICRFFNNGNCKHGMKGKACKYTHPKTCSHHHHLAAIPKGACNYPHFSYSVLHAAFHRSRSVAAFTMS